jgi:DNA-binding NarL/FixJ family response regulator
MVDDHPLIRLGTSNLIKQSTDCILVAQLSNRNELMEWLEAGQEADVVLLDRFLPDGDGLDLVNDLKTRELKVIVLSIADSDTEIAEAIEYGVDGYLIKTCEPDQLNATIKNVYEGQSSFPNNVMQRMASGKFYQSEIDCLTPRQQEIVECVKQGMSNKIIARNLKLSENTVRNHMRYIMDKLKVKNRVQVAALGLKNGKKKHNRP